MKLLTKTWESVPPLANLHFLLVAFLQLSLSPPRGCISTLSTGSRLCQDISGIWHFIPRHHKRHYNGYLFAFFQEYGVNWKNYFTERHNFYSNYRVQMVKTREYTSIYRYRRYGEGRVARVNRRRLMDLFDEITFQKVTD